MRIACLIMPSQWMSYERALERGRISYNRSKSPHVECGQFSVGDQSSEGKTGSLSEILPIYHRRFTDEMKQKTVCVDFTSNCGSSTCGTGKELLGELICPSHDLSREARLRGRMCCHELHAESTSINGHCRVFDQVREDTPVETQGRHDPAQPLSSHEHRHNRSRLAEAHDSRRSERFAQNLGHALQLLPQYLAFDAPDDLKCHQDCSGLRRRDSI